MRKIQSPEETAKKKKRNNMIIGLFMLAVLVLGTVGYGFSGFSDSAQNTEDSQENQEPNLRNSLDSVKTIPVTLNKTLNDFIGKTLYIASENQEATNEIASTLGIYSQRIQLVCHGSCEQDLPEKDCSEEIIVFKDSPENKVYQEENCIFIEGDIKAVDAFLYKILGYY